MWIDCKYLMEGNNLQISVPCDLTRQPSFNILEGKPNFAAGPKASGPSIHNIFMFGPPSTISSLIRTLHIYKYSKLGNSSKLVLDTK